MKKIIYSALLASGILLVSCATDKKDDPTAPAPSTDARDKFVAYWSVSENSSTAGTNTHTVNILKSTTNSSEIQINNFSGLSIAARASLNNNIITIPYQQLGSIGFTQGTGTLTSATSISLSYTNTIASSPPDNCTAIYTKQ
ncbi:MAG: hypothetical protein KAZ71_05375 [Bacteroidia bacterium]|nr:hypothetical protein [Bacteroidia bacterium]